MSLNLNKFLFAGRLTRRPELKTTTTGKRVCTFTVAVDRPPKEDGEHDADFLNVTAWEKNAEFVTRYFDKGSAIFGEGSIRTRSYTDPKTQEKRFVTEIVADRLDFVESRNASTPQAGGPPSSPYYQKAAVPQENPSRSSSVIPGYGYEDQRSAQMKIDTKLEPLVDSDEELPF